MKSKSTLSKIGFSASAVLVAFIIIFPLYVIVKNAFTTEAELFTVIPSTITLKNIVFVLTATKFFSSLTMTVLATLLSVGLSLLLATPAAWALVRSGWKRATGFILTVAVMSRLFPPVTVGIPLASILLRLGLHDTILGLTLGFILLALPYVLIVMRGQFETIPPELEEAAMVDGYSRFGAFIRVTLPAAAPGLAAAAIFSFLFAWGELMLPLLITSMNRPLTVMAYRYTKGASYTLASGVAFMQLIPVFIFTYVLQRFLKPEYLAGAFKY